MTDLKLEDYSPAFGYSKLVELEKDFDKNRLSVLKELKKFQDQLFEKRNGIIKSWFKRTFFKERFSFIDYGLAVIEYAINELESEPTKKLILEAQNKLLEVQNELAPREGLEPPTE